MSQGCVHKPQLLKMKAEADSNRGLSTTYRLTARPNRLTGECVCVCVCVLMSVDAMLHTQEITLFARHVDLIETYLVFDTQSTMTDR